MTDKSYLNLVRGFGIYHALAIAPLMLPIVSDKVLGLLGQLHTYLQLPGEWRLAGTSEMLFINLFACVAFIWGMVRARHPSRTLGLYEGWGMLLMSAVVIYYVIQGASPIWLVVALVDIPGGLLHLTLKGKGE